MPKETRKRAKLPVARLAGLALLMTLLAGTEIWRDYDQATRAAERSVAAFVRLLAGQTESTIRVIDLTLIGIRDALQVAPSLLPNDPTLRATLKERLKNLPYVRALFVVGADGFITHDTDYPTTPLVSLEDRAYFLAHRDNLDLGLRIGRPLRSRSVGDWFVSASRRINHPDGSFAGVVVAAIVARSLKRFYKDLSLDKGDIIALLLKDGTLLARAPDHSRIIGKSVPLRHALRSSSGTAWGISPIDGVKRVIGFQVLSGVPLIVTAGRPASAIYASWVDHAVVVAGGAILMWALAAGLMLHLAQRKHRELLEKAHLAQVQRLETMGIIAGGIAHDVGNAVKVARTTFALIKPSLAAHGHALALVGEADQSLKSAFDIIDRLLAFARRQELAPTATDLGQLISQFMPILRQAAGSRAELGLDIAKDQPFICLVDPIHLEAALLNLVLNSKEAVAQGGRILIELREVQPPRRRYSMARMASANRPWAEITVKDDGVGMPRDVLERAFEPFYTTRSNGSGLGLSQVLGFVQQSAGEVRIESREGRGTTVRLLFPQVEGVGSRE